MNASTTSWWLSRSLPLAALFGATTTTVATQTPIYTFHGNFTGQYFGWDVDRAGDIDQDGYSDLVVAAPGADRVTVWSGRLGTLLKLLFVGSDSGLTVCGPGDLNADGFDDIIVGQAGVVGHGVASAYSGKTWAKLYTLEGTLNFGAWFGRAVDSVGDVDLDGGIDFVVSDPGESLLVSGQGTVRLYSGVTGAKKWTIFGEPVPFVSFGTSVAGVGDLDGDGLGDLAGGMGGFQTIAGGNYVRIYSCPNGNLVHEILAPTLSNTWGSRVAAAGDVNLDGTPDLIVGDPKSDLAGPSFGAVYVYSGADWSTLHTFVGGSANDYFGFSVSGAGDVDGDGQPDVIASSMPKGFNPSGSQPGYARALSGADGTVLFTASSGLGSSVDYFGSDVSDAGDVNGDGTPDIVVGAPLDFTNAINAGMVRVFSGQSLPLQSDHHLISTFSGGTATFRLTAGAAHANALYLLLGTTSGTAPGIAIGTVLVPLNLDAYLLFTAGNPSTPPLSGSLGLLSGTGTALAQFSIPASAFPSLVGLSAHHAYVLLESFALSFASNAVPLTFEP